MWLTRRYTTTCHQLEAPYISPRLWLCDLHCNYHHWKLYHSLTHAHLFLSAFSVSMSNSTPRNNLDAVRRRHQTDGNGSDGGKNEVLQKACTNINRLYIVRWHPLYLKSSKFKPSKMGGNKETSRDRARKFVTSFTYGFSEVTCSPFESLRQGKWNTT